MRADNTPTRGKPISKEDAERARVVLAEEYKVLSALLSSAWSASLTRTTIFLGVLSAAGVALGFAAQGGIDGVTGGFTTLALVVLPLLLFLGAATFVRLVQIQRESAVYIAGMNRIRQFWQQYAPASGPYFILPAHDDFTALFRGVGTGMLRRPPRFPLIYLVVQTQGIVGVVTGGVAAAFVGLALSGTGALVLWTAVVLAFLATVSLLFAYWQRSLDDLRDSIQPINPTPADEVGEPF